MKKDRRKINGSEKRKVAKVRKRRDWKDKKNVKNGIKKHFVIASDDKCV